MFDISCVGDSADIKELAQSITVAPEILGTREDIFTLYIELFDSIGLIFPQLLSYNIEELLRNMITGATRNLHYFYQKCKMENSTCCACAMRNGNTRFVEYCVNDISVTLRQSVYNALEVYCKKSLIEYASDISSENIRKIKNLVAMFRSLIVLTSQSLLGGATRTIEGDTFAALKFVNEAHDAFLMAGKGPTHSNIQPIGNVIQEDYYTSLVYVVKGVDEPILFPDTEAPIASEYPVDRITFNSLEQANVIVCLTYTLNQIEVQTEHQSTWWHKDTNVPINRKTNSLEVQTEYMNRTSNSFPLPHNSVYHSSRPVEGYSPDSEVNSNIIISTTVAIVEFYDEITFESIKTRNTPYQFTFPILSSLNRSFGIS